MYYDFGDVSKFEIHFVEWRLPVRVREGFVGAMGATGLGKQDGYLYDHGEFDRQFETMRKEAEESKD